MEKRIAMIFHFYFHYFFSRNFGKNWKNMQWEKKYFPSLWMEFVSLFWDFSFFSYIFFSFSQLNKRFCYRFVAFECSNVDCVRVWVLSNIRLRTKSSFSFSLSSTTKKKIEKKKKLKNCTENVMQRKWVTIERIRDKREYGRWKKCQRR